MTLARLSDGYLDVKLSATANSASEAEVLWETESGPLSEIQAHW